MFKRVGLPVLLLTLALVLAAFIGGAALALEEPIEREGSSEAEFEDRMERKTERKQEKIEILEDEGVITAEEAEKLREALQERDSFTRGECPEEGPRNCEVKLNLRDYQEERRAQNREDNSRSSSGNGFKGGW